MGFKINTYDQCVANKEIDGKQCTIIWYVDNLKVSHMYIEVVRDIFKLIDSKFEGDLDITIKNNYVYLGMDITFTDEVTVDIRIEGYIREAIQAFGEDIIMSINTPETRTLFEVKRIQNYWGMRNTTHTITSWQKFYMWPRDAD